MIVVVSPFFMKYFVAGHASAITLFPFIVVNHERHKDDIVLMNHEKIHIQQQIELLVIGFYIMYLTEYIIRLLAYKNHFAAYRQISFEQEAYDYEEDLFYLQKRGRWAWLRKSYFKL